jgi:Zn-dependent protease with chaperone function
MGGYVKKFKNLALVLLFVTAVPILGIFTSAVIGSRYNAEFVQMFSQEVNVPISKVHEMGISVESFCKRSDAVKEICSFQDTIDLLRNSSLITTFLGLGLIVFIFLAKLIAGRDRKKLAVVFNPTTVIALCVLSVSMLMQSGIFTYAIYLLEATFIKRVHFGVIGSIAIASLMGSIGLFRSAFALTKDKPIVIFGEKLDLNNGGKLISLVNNIAIKLGAQKPTNIVVGIEPNFYVTGAKVRLAEQENELNGTTMYVSMPYLSILNKDELTAVIGHELGHFKGKDTIFSLKFYPAYARLSKSMEEMENVGLLSLPAIFTIDLIHSEFSAIEREIRRERELEADKVGASANGALPLVTALLKFSYFSTQWDAIQEHNIQKLNEGEIYSNLPALISEVAKMQFEKLDFDAVYADLLGSHISHPTDTHPSIKKRMVSLSISESSINKDMLKPANISLDQYIDNSTNISEKLTLAEHRLMIGLGLATIESSGKSGQDVT